MSQIAGKTVDQKSYQLASVVRLGGGEGALMVTPAVGTSISNASALRYKILEGDTVAANQTLISMPDNVGGGTLIYRQQNGDSPSGVLKINGAEGATPVFTLKPSETFAVPANVTELRFVTTTNAHYQFIYLVKA